MGLVAFNLLVFTLRLHWDKVPCGINECSCVMTCDK